MKIAVVGGGSTYTPELVEGIGAWALEPGGPTHLTLVDVDEARQGVVAGFTARMLRHGGSSVVLEATTDLRAGLKGADFVVIQIRVGGQAGRHEDILLGLRHGLIGQETTGVGGLAKALRSIPAVLDIVEVAQEVAPDAWIVNFTNPAGMVTEAILNHRTARAVGLCNVPRELQIDIAAHLKVGEQDLELDWIGLNHLGWIRRIMLRGADVLPEVIRVLESPGAPANIPEISYPKGFLGALGMMPSSYVRYYYETERMLDGIRSSPRTRAQEVAKIEEKLLDLYRDEAVVEKPKFLSERGGAWYSRVACDVMRALRSPEGAVHIVNTANRGVIPSLPDDASVEVRCTIDETGITPLPLDPPEACIAGLIQQVKAYERLGVQAAVNGDRDALLMALNAHPLVPSATVASRVAAEIIERGLI
jgi:6-phospho-beta-glucosidase